MAFGCGGSLLGERHPAYVQRRKECQLGVRDYMVLSKTVRESNGQYRNLLDPRTGEPLLRPQQPLEMPQQAVVAPQGWRGPSSRW